MKLTPLGSNRTLLELSSGLQILFSYKTPVAGYCAGIGYFRTTQKWSATTSKHIGMYFKENKVECYQEMYQEDINKLADQETAI